MKKLLLIVFAIGTASIASGQTPGAATSDCKLTKAQAPVIRGLRLGLTVNQVLALFPGAERDERLKQQLRNRFGFQSLSIVPHEYVVGDRFLGVKSISFAFLDDHLTYYSLNYNGPEWKDTAQFASRVAEVLRLPNVESWKNVDGNNLGLVCNGFQLTVTPNVINLKDLQTDVNRVVRERAEVPKEEARRNFKP
jgi:hypothetical protein